MVDGEWVDDPSRIKEAFRIHFATCFQSPNVNRSRLAFEFPKTLNPEQVSELESLISKDEIRKAVWACSENKSPEPDGFTFEFFRKFWDNIGSDFCSAVEWFFDHCSFAKGSNSSFIALIPKSHEPKLVTDYRPICLIGSLYKVVTKILAMRLSLVISELISDVQTAFVAVVDAGIFKGIKIDNSVTISHLFYADDAVFIGEWSQDNLNRILNVLYCFHLASALRVVPAGRVVPARGFNEKS
nr:transposon TX1 uncharacterized [Tanacetum cinerariifolium]